MASRILATTGGLSQRHDQSRPYCRTISFAQTSGNEEILGNISFINDHYPRIAVSRGASVWITGLEDSSISYYKKNIAVYEDFAAHPVILMFRLAPIAGSLYLEPMFYTNFDFYNDESWRSLVFAPNDLFAVLMTMPLAGQNDGLPVQSNFCIPFTWLNKNTSAFLDVTLHRSAPGQYSYAEFRIKTSWAPKWDKGMGFFYAEGIPASGSTSYASQGTNADQVQMMVNEATARAVSEVTVPAILADDNFNSELKNKVREASEKLYVAV